MANRNQNNTTGYEHPQESNLHNVHHGMAYNGGGQPVLRVNGYGPSQTSAFGEPYAITPTPIVQLDAIYGADDPLQYESFSALGGSTGAQDSQYVVSAGATTFSYGVLRTRRFLRYRPGQGGLARFAARFTQGVANTQQRAGLFNQENGFFIGYNGDEFSILHQHGGRVHIECLTITTAPTAAQTATITLNGTDYTVNLVNESAALTAARIGRSGVFTGWTVEAYDNEVIFLSQGANQPLGGAFTFASTGNAVGTMTTKQEGVVDTNDWIPQSEWNGDLASSGITLDPTKFNVFQINYRWLGAGEIRFSMENPETGDFMTLHHIHWTNRNTTLHSENPSLKLGFVAYNLGGGAVSVYGGSLLMANEGIISVNTYPKASYISRSSLGANTIHHLATVLNPITQNGKVNTREIILNELGIAFQGNDPLTLIGYLDATLATGTHQFNSQTDTITKASLVTGTFTLGANQPIVAFTLPINGSGQFDLSKYRLILSPGASFSLAVTSGQPISQISASLIGQAD